MITEYIKKSFHIYIDAIRQDIENSRDVDYFRPHGTQIFCGRQGQGKTISMVKCALDIKKRYPKCIIVTNLKLNVDFEYITFSTLEELSSVLTEVNNDKYGVLYLIDEIQNYFNSLESKGIPPWVFTEISQQRKQRKCIMGTSQLFLRVAKPFREQVDTLIMCRCFYNIFNIMWAYRGDTLLEDFGKVSGELQKIGFYFQSRKLRDTYDTYQKISRANVNIYEDKTALKINFTPKKK